jgi:hypothetical protein
LAFVANVLLSLALYQAFFSIPASRILGLFGAAPGYGEDHVGRTLFVLLVLVPALAVGLSTLCLHGLRRTRKALLILSVLSVLSLPAYALCAWYGHTHGGAPLRMAFLAPLPILLYAALSEGILRILPRTRDA